MPLVVDHHYYLNWQVVALVVCWGVCVPGAAVATYVGQL